MVVNGEAVEPVHEPPKGEVGGVKKVLFDPRRVETVHTWTVGAVEPRASRYHTPLPGGSEPADGTSHADGVVGGQSGHGTNGVATNGVATNGVATNGVATNGVATGPPHP